MSDSGSLFGDVHKPSARAIYEQRKKYSNFIVADVSQYAVNHLVTFSIGEEDDLTSVEDAIRKLCIMDKQGKIWVQEMLLQVNGSAIKLLDINSKEELENFALPTVAYCDVVCPESRARSLLVLMCQETTQLRPDIHFFDCEQIRAEWIQQDISSALLDFNTGGDIQRREALRAAQNMLDNQEVFSQPPMQVPSRTKIVAPGPREDAILIGEPDLSNIPIEQNVELLNRIFDDVEAFVRKLQKCAEAFRDLNQYRSSARGRLRTPREGLLTIRAKPPSQEEFEDALSKIKYSFSLLARLKPNISGPSSEELICILFKPLKMIVDASGGVEFASELRNPMLTLEAVTLMQSCLGEWETELWHSLGENWTKPRVDFPRGYAASYNLTFCSGWEPPNQDAFGRLWEDPVEMQNRHEERRNQQSAPTIAANGCKHLEKKSVICTHNFTARNSNELSVLQGDILEVLDDSKKWWKAQNCYGQVGYVPYNILAPMLNGDHSSIQNDKEIIVIHEINPIITEIPPPQPPAKTKNLQPDAVKWVSTEDLDVDDSKKDHFTMVNEELVLRLANGTGGGSKPLHIPRTLDTDAPLDYNSNSDQVQTWLEAKGFSPMIVSALGILNGAQLFSLKKDELRAINPEEGPRVYSQVTIQKALLKDSGKMSELEAVMARQKRKAEGLD
ncbi:PREDICTED: epidermal growth factor receptor kinase substrate 8-like protein 1 [Thamnophis sirtalis]|uniref:Epidermal growth factor receptor kinase substrate 8-like protein 1 n=1 Tax=Thamnophis sirtalis TaxID=35019 RepID=A0A6I9Y3A1_9SAUR|nr:PREDICTED: epidermal growth factor receptor kinase substrate 8-like protein 1 [Thamnophis sirtalis]